ncbi:MAG TPA: acyl-CoA dehydrogenase, partial [Acidimicrobiales bacterium]
MASTVDELLDGLLADLPPGKVDDRTFLGAQFDRGLAWVHFPEGLGGSGLNPGLQQRVTQRLLDAGAPFPSPVNLIGLGMVAPT